ncbi:hypothetical protein GLYMA_02G092100v4 [Glycine max]|nr:hypothetical protein GLYMA_02G092100v4 [Glycine max]KAH1059498.1 hypothetical protein GYH30_003488 [Glycine max]
MAKENQGFAIGIDLGTTYSCVAVWLEQHNRVEIIHNDQDAKRLIGRKHSDSTIQKVKMMWPFKIVAGVNDKPIIIVNYKGKEKHLWAEEVSSMILLKMKEIAEA